jgi:hypothetical protein
LTRVVLTDAGRAATSLLNERAALRAVPHCPEATAEEMEFS